MNIKHIITSALLIGAIILSSCKKDENEPSTFDTEVLEAVNTHRSSIGLIPLQQNDFLWELAHENSKKMADAKSLAVSGGLEERIDRIRNTLGLGAVAESVAAGTGTASEIVGLWLGSVSLKEKMEGNYNLTGLSAVKGDDGNWYFTQIFYNQ